MAFFSSSLDLDIRQANQGDLPEGVVERAKGGMKDRGGQAGPSVGGSGVHGMQDDANRGPLLQRDDDDDQNDQQP
jgi:hypothetical protein